MRRQTDLIVSKVHNAYRLSVQGDSSWLGLTFSPDEAPDALPPVPGTERYVRLPRQDRRPYFVMRRPGRPDVVAADVAVEIPTVANFRDMGGYLNQEGRVVRWGRFFRSSALADLSEADQAVLAGLRLRYVVDYRSPFELRQAPDMVPPGAEYLHLPAIGTGNPKLTLLTEINLMDELHVSLLREAPDALLMLYRELPFDNPSYGRMLHTLDTLEEGAMLQHCSVGKDRTGVGSALVLLALGVDEETVIQDYTLSTIFRENFNNRLLQQARDRRLSQEIVQAMDGMINVSRDLLEHTFAAIRQRYGSYSRYFLEEYSIDEAHLAAWREMHTLPAC